MDRFLRPVQPTASTPDTAKMAPARCADVADGSEVSGGMGQLSHGDPLQMSPFTPPSDLSPCLSRSLQQTPGRGTYPDSPGISHTQNAPASPADIQQGHLSMTDADVSHHILSSPPPAHTTGPMLSSSVEQTLWSLLQQLPTRADFEALADRVETALRGEVQGLKQEVAELDKRLTVVEQGGSTVEQSIQTVQASQVDIMEQLVNLQLHLDDLENRSRRQNIRLRGIPESVQQGDLRTTVTSIFNRYLDRQPDAEIVIDRVHRTLGPQSLSPDRPRDVLCRLHYYSLKEEILQKAWQVGILEFDGAAVHLLPDVSRKTLLMRKALKPLLEQLGELGYSYKWGHPFHVIVRKGNLTFVLRRPSDLPDLYAFADMEPLHIPNWLTVTASSDPLPRRPVEGRQGYRLNQRPQRGRRRPPRRDVP